MKAKEDFSEKMAYHKNYQFDTDNWRQDPKKIARIYQFQRKLDKKQEVEDKSVNKLIGNILTDRRWWREDPEEVYSTMNEGLLKRANLMFRGRRGVKPHPRKQEWFFGQFFDNGLYQVSSLYADKADLDITEEVDRRLSDLLETAYNQDKDREAVKEAFHLLDSFNYSKTVEEFEEKYETGYFDDRGPDFVIDQVASDVLSDLDGSAKTFFQMYIAPGEERPKESFPNETVAETYESKIRMPRSRDAYIEDGLDEFERLLDEEEYEQAKYMVGRFDLPATEIASILEEKH